MKFTVAIVAVSVAAVSSFAPAATFVRVSWSCISEDEKKRSEVLHCRVRCRRMCPSKFHCCVRCRCMWPSKYNFFQNCYIQRMIVSTDYLLTLLFLYSTDYRSSGTLPWWIQTRGCPTPPCPRFLRLRTRHWRKCWRASCRCPSCRSTTWTNLLWLRSLRWRDGRKQIHHVKIDERMKRTLLSALGTMAKYNSNEIDKSSMNK